MILERFYYFPLSLSLSLSAHTQSSVQVVSKCAEGVGSRAIRATNTGLRPSLTTMVLGSSEAIL